MRTSLTFASVLLATLLSLSCGGGGGEGGPNATCIATDTFTWNSIVNVETQSAVEPAYCDPQIQTIGYADLASTGNPGLNVLLHRDFDAPAGMFQEFVSINIYGMTVQNYPIGGSAGQSGLVWFQGVGNMCLATTGSVNITQIGAVGGLVEGTINITAFNTIGAAVCTAPKVGSFSMTREADM